MSEELAMSDEDLLNKLPPPVPRSAAVAELERRVDKLERTVSWLINHIGGAVSDDIRIRD
jgi:hypothetical protein